MPTIYVGRVSPATGRFSEWPTVGTRARVSGKDGNVYLTAEETDQGTIWHVVAEATDLIGNAVVPDMQLRFRGNYETDVRFARATEE